MEHNNELGRKNIPMVGFIGKPFQYDCYGNFRIVVKGHASEWTSPCGMTMLTIDGEWIGNDEIHSKEVYIGVDDIHTGVLPKECPLLITVVDGDGDTNFVHVKIVDLTTGETLGEDDVDEHLYDFIYSDNMGVTVKDSSIKDYVKVRITTYGSNFDEDSVMSKEDVEGYLTRTFPSDEFDVLDVDRNKIN